MAVKPIGAVKTANGLMYGLAANHLLLLRPSSTARAANIHLLALHALLTTTPAKACGRRWVLR
jgi:hypothetical protein